MTSPFFRAALCAAAFLFAVPAHAQTNLARVVGGAYDRSHDYDLVHQAITLSGFDWDATAFDGRVASTLVARRSGLDSLVLDAGHLLGIRSVTDAAGATLRYTHRGDSLIVYPSRPAAFGDTLRFSITYAGQIDNGHGLTYIQAEGRPHRPQQIWSQGEATSNHFWFPTYDWPNDKMTWEVDATVPAGYTAVSNGALTADRTNPDGTRTMHWSQNKPSATYLVSLIVSPLAKLHDTWRGKPVDYYVYRADSSLAWPLFHVTPDMIEVYSRLTGVPYPWAKYAQTTVADFFGGMENVSATTLVDWLPDANAYQDRPWYQWILIPHELAHQWFGDYVTTEDWANLWLNEGFAEFMPGQYWGETLGRLAAEDYYLDEYDDYMGIDSRRRMPIVAEHSNVIYPKGALVLEMLRTYLGPDRFWASIHHYLQTHAYGTATTDDLRQAIREASGQNLDWFFEEWLYQAGHPEFTVTTDYDQAARRLTLHVEQTQQDTAKTDTTGLRFVTPEVFKMPVTIRVATASGDVTRSFQIDDRKETLVLDGVGEPQAVVFDARNQILKTLTFDQPTAWLAKELRSDTVLWNQRWAIEQLRGRKGDAAAGQALAAAATGASYFRTRAAAAEALGGFPATVALPALVDAVEDSASTVRAAAVAALADVRGEQADRIAHDVWAHDPSYQVRAAALSTIAKLDSTKSRSVLRTALTTPSYRNVIRNAALRAVVQTRDTRLIPDIEKLLGEDYLPSSALGALARESGGPALDRLVAHLGDERVYVRRWVLSALGRVNPKVAVPALREALPDIQNPDTKQSVQDLIARLQQRSEGSAAGG
ncbi:MAG TPA: M1 family aminopeptidase [Rhodothermales bacterium]|nr:M1 family aminopeptidase [Rhodothermales bacterium]